MEGGEGRGGEEEVVGRFRFRLVGVWRGLKGGRESYALASLGIAGSVAGCGWASFSFASMCFFLSV